MIPASIANPGVCDFNSPYMLLFSESIPPLVYYSHLPIALIATLLGLFVLYKRPKLAASHGLLLMTLSFSLWVILDSVFWASNRGDIITFVWSMQILVEPLIYIGALYLMYALINNKPLPFSSLVAISALYLPVILTVPTGLMLYAFDENSCLSLEGPLATYYTYGIELLFLSYLIFFTVKGLVNFPSRRKELALLLVGIVALLLTFSVGNIVSSFSGDWQTAQIGLFFMPLFMGVFVYSIVQYNTLRIKVISSYALVAGITGLTFSLLFVTNTSIFRSIAAVTFVASLGFGFLLIRAVAKEVKQREEIEKLADNLERANEKLKELDKMKSEFVSIASHQLRSPLTSIRGYTSMLLEGSFGQMPEKAKDAIDRIGESARLMSMSVEDYLNVSRIQSGNMKYELSDFNLRDMASRISDDMRREAIRKGLLLTFKDNLHDSKGITHADVGKTNQIIHNLIDNAMKYTPKGKIEIVMTENKKAKRLMVNISDTGIGMAPGTAEKLFEKFRRADNANGVNASGTGLGLYIARRMAQDMKGDITVTSPGDGLGSTFTLTLPLHL